MTGTNPAIPKPAVIWLETTHLGESLAQARYVGTVIVRPMVELINDLEGVCSCCTPYNLPEVMSLSQHDYTDPMRWWL